MKLFLISAAAAALVFVSPAAFAQDHHQGHGDHKGGSAHESHKAPAAAAKPAAPARTPRAAPKTKTRVERTKPGSWAAAHRATVKTTASPGAVYNNAVRNNNRQRDNRRGNDRDNNRHQGDRNNNSHQGNWNNNRNHGNYGDNNRGSRHSDFNRRNVTARHHYRYRGNSWSWPSGHSYRRWSYGMTLPSLFWGSNYWISDYSNYGLAYPPPGTVWVRYGDDAILIDRYSGEILEVVYGQFY